VSQIKKIVFILCCSIFFVSPIFACSSMVQEMDPDSIVERIAPLAQVNIGVEVAAEAVATGPADPATTYKSFCSLCHEAGVAGAPKFRDAATWGDRAAVGIDALVKSAITGKGAMPPKGTCMQCSDEELKAVIEHMLPQ
jgi:cytochrome c5